MRFTIVLCRSTGEPVAELTNLVSRQIVQQLNVPMGVTIQMNVEDEWYEFASVEQQPRIKLYRARTDRELELDSGAVRELLFYGSLVEDGVSEDSGAGVATLPFQDPSWVLNDRFAHEARVYTAADEGGILWDMINEQNNRTNGSTWILENTGSVATGHARDRTYERGKNIAELIAEMTAVLDGPDVGVLPYDGWDDTNSRDMGKFTVWSPQRGEDKPDALFVYAAPTDADIPGGLASNVGSMVRSRARIVTSATMVGAGEQIVETYQNTTTAYGLREVFETHTDISLAGTLLEKATGKVVEYQVPRSLIEIVEPTTEAPQPFIDYCLGDTVYATCRRGHMRFSRAPLRVHGIDLTVDEDGALSTKLTVSEAVS